MEEDVRMTATYSRKIKDLHGKSIATPRVFYRGEDPGSTLRIKTGDDYWDSKLFLSSNEASARDYGRHVTTWMADPTAKILYEGTKPFRSMAKGLRGSLLQFSSGVARRAEDAGYDAVWFLRQGDVGTVVLNRGKFTKVR